MTALNNAALTERRYSRLLIAADDLRRGLAQSKPCARLLILGLTRLYLDDVGIRTCATLIVDP